MPERTSVQIFPGVKYFPSAYNIPVHKTGKTNSQPTIHYSVISNVVIPIIKRL